MLRRSLWLAVAMGLALSNRSEALASLDPGNNHSLSDPYSVPDSTADRISELLAAHTRMDMFSGVVLVAKDGEVVFEGAFGDANKDHSVPNTLNTRFNIGSIGKTFTAVAIMQLVETGALRLTDHVTDFFPDFPFPEGDEITLRHLLTHTSGLGDYLEHEDYSARMATLHSIDDAVSLVYDQEPAFPPGTDFQYSNSGFLLLGSIIEEVSGLPYPQYLEEHIFGPLGMDQSGIVFQDQVLPHRSTGYTKNWDGTYRANTRLVPPPCSAGGLQTTARDLLKFDGALNGNALLSEESKGTMFTPTELHPTYGLGWEIKEFAGHGLVGHSGGTEGVEAFFYRFIDDGYTLITLSNYDGGNGQVPSEIEAILFGQDYSIPTQVDADFTLGYALQARGNHADAVKVFARNLESGSPHLLSLFFSANSRIQVGLDLEEAVRELDRFIQAADAETLPPRHHGLGPKGPRIGEAGKKGRSDEVLPGNPSVGAWE